MVAPSNSALGYNLNNATSSHPPLSATRTYLLGQLMTYPELTLTLHPTSFLFTRRPGISPKKKHKLGEERCLAAKAEADKLLNAGFIEEAHYTTWLSNVVLVKKANGKWRMCVNYTDLNKASPRDAYPLPNIDRLIDGVAGNKVLSFLDAYSGYNQIPMATFDMNKTAFIIDHANYFYKVMPFGQMCRSIRR